MKIFVLIFLTLILSNASASDSDDYCNIDEEEAETATEMVTSAELVDVVKQGFLTVDKCAAAGEFRDCYLDNYACGSNNCARSNKFGKHVDVNLVLFVHKDLTTYNLDMSHIDVAKIDEGINRNDITIMGKYNASTNTIIAYKLKSPPPPKKTFFKGCL